RDLPQARQRANLAFDVRGRELEAIRLVADERDLKTIAATALELHACTGNVAQHLGGLGFENLLRAARAVGIVDLDRERAATHGARAAGATAAAAAALRTDRR